jgi:hypothetical protein
MNPELIAGYIGPPRKRGSIMRRRLDASLTGRRRRLTDHVRPLQTDGAGQAKAQPRDHSTAATHKKHR